MRHTKTYRAVLAVSALLISTKAALAQDYYLGGSFAAIEYSESGLDDADLTSIYGRAGAKLNDYLSAEIRAGVGVGDDSVGFLGVDVNVELENFFGAYVRGGIPTGSIAYPYIIAGYTRGEVEASALGFSESESESDISYGVGLDLNMNEQITLNIEYINYLDKNETEVSGFSVGVVWLF